MRVPGQDAWKALMRIDRASGKIDVDVDQEGRRWTPDMADPEAFALGLR